MRVFTIGFTKKSAEYFFDTLTKSGVTKLVDVRLNNVSQLAGFAKRKDLEYFLERICNIEYVHAPELAPTKDMLDAYRKHGDTWDTYEGKYLELLKTRKVENSPVVPTLDDACLLCSEDQPHHCHRRLVVEYLQARKRRIDVTHLT